MTTILSEGNQSVGLSDVVPTTMVANIHSLPDKLTAGPGLEQFGERENGGEGAKLMNGREVEGKEGEAMMSPCGGGGYATGISAKECLFPSMASTKEDQQPEPSPKPSPMNSPDIKHDRSLTVDHLELIPERDHEETTGSLGEEESNEEEAHEVLVETEDLPSQACDAAAKSTVDENVTEPKPVRLFVGQVPETMVEPHLTSLFKTKGIKVMDIAIIRDKHTGRHRHCAFITVPSRAQADLAVSEFHNKKYLESMSNPMQVKEANQPKPKSAYLSIPPLQAGIGTIGSTAFFSAPAKGIYKLPTSSPGFTSFIPLNTMLPNTYLQQYQAQMPQYSLGSTYGTVPAAPYVYGYLPSQANVSGMGNVGYQIPGSTPAGYQMPSMSSLSPSGSVTLKQQEVQPNAFPNWSKPVAEASQGIGVQSTRFVVPGAVPGVVNGSGYSAMTQEYLQPSPIMRSTFSPNNMEKSDFAAADNLPYAGLPTHGAFVGNPMSNHIPFGGANDLPEALQMNGLGSSHGTPMSSVSMGQALQHGHRGTDATTGLSGLSAAAFGGAPGSFTNVSYAATMATVQSQGSTELAGNVYGYHAPNLHPAFCAVPGKLYRASFFPLITSHYLFRDEAKTSDVCGRSSRGELIRQQSPRAPYR